MKLSVMVFLVSFQEYYILMGGNEELKFEIVRDTCLSL